MSISFRQRQSAHVIRAVSMTTASDSSGCGLRRNLYFCLFYDGQDIMSMNEPLSYVKILIRGDENQI